MQPLLPQHPPCPVRTVLKKQMEKSTSQRGRCPWGRQVPAGRVSRPSRRASRWSCPWLWAQAHAGSSAASEPQRGLCTESRGRDAGCSPSQALPAGQCPAPSRIRSPVDSCLSPLPHAFSAVCTGSPFSAREAEVSRRQGIYRRRTGSLRVSFSATKTQTSWAPAAASQCALSWDAGLCRENQVTVRPPGWALVRCGKERFGPRQQEGRRL